MGLGIPIGHFLQDFLEMNTIFHGMIFEKNMLKMEVMEFILLIKQLTMNLVLKILT